MLSNNDKIMLKGMSLEQLENWSESINISKFRAKQIYEWIYLHGINNFDLMHNLSIELRTILKKTCSLSSLTLHSHTKSSNENTIKYLFKTNDGNFIESVSMIDDNDRHTICVSSQSGCNLGCDFCATAKMGLMKNLTAGEIIDQLIIIRNLSKKPINNVVYMGMGEPFLNYENVIQSANILNDKKGFNISTKKITISTVGIVSKINKFIEQGIPYRLAISLNASNDNVRNKLMPINKKWPIADLIEMNKKYSKKQKRKKITFEYVIIDEINSSINHAKELANILKSAKCKVNIIPYNEIDQKYKRPTTDTINKFIETLNLSNNNHFQIMVRWSNGLDIDAGCGQLAIANNIKGDK